MSEKELVTVLRHLIEDRPVSEDELELARHKMQCVLLEAQEFGFSEADVVKAILGPALIPEPECGCPGCRIKAQTSGRDFSSNGTLL